MGPIEICSGVMSEVTSILSALERGDPGATEKLLPLVYDELRKLADQRLAHENPGQTWQATALVHEVFLRLVDVDQVQEWKGRGHFFAAAAEAMRRLLVESARRKKRAKRGGDLKRVSLEDADAAVVPPSEDILALDEALTRLAEHDSIKAAVVKLRFFAGLTMPEIARALNISLGTVERHWTYARTWLYAELSDPDSLQS